MEAALHNDYSVIEFSLLVQVINFINIEKVHMLNIYTTDAGLAIILAVN